MHKLLILCYNTIGCYVYNLCLYDYMINDRDRTSQLKKKCLEQEGMVLLAYAKFMNW